jgi:hypothetical protein
VQVIEPIVLSIRAQTRRSGPLRASGFARVIAQRAHGERLLIRRNVAIVSVVGVQSLHWD